MNGNKTEKSSQTMVNELCEFWQINIKKLTSHIPEPFSSLAREKLRQICEMVLEARAPRFIIVGRRGAGKSSLVNAIFGQKVAEVGSVKSTTARGKWYDYKDERGKLSILDTRGLGEADVQDGKAPKKTAEEQVKQAINDSCPDALLFLCKAKEVDARIDEDVRSLSEIISYVQNKHDFTPLIVGIVTQVDELDPIEVVEPPYKDEEKQRNINHATKILREKLKGVSDTLEVIPTSAYIHFKNGRIVHDRRWNIDKLIEYLIEKLPQSVQLELARIVKIKSAQKKLARSLIGTSATMAWAVGVEPIPIADLPIITSIQIGMIIGIGYISGRKMDKRSAIEFMTAMGLNVGLSFGFRELARALVKLVPVIGDVVSGGIAAAATWGIGEAAIAYFIDKKSLGEARRIYEEEMEKRQEIDTLATRG